MSTLTSPSIIVTAGPSLDNEETLQQLISMNVSWFRFNMSHGDHEEHKNRQAKILSAAKEMNKHINCFIDLRGPKMRVCAVENESLDLVKGEQVFIKSESILCTKESLAIDVPQIHKYLQPSMSIFLHDGEMELNVLEVKEDGALCEVIRGGVLEGHKGVNIPDALIPIDTITEKDMTDLKNSLSSMQVDAVALSFVRTKEDILGLRQILDELGSHAKIISKIETKLALHNIDTILEVSDIVMFARGDLGVEIPAVKIPLAQKELCIVAKSKDTPVIVATQMLTSMKESPIPTRAEMTDAIEALVDGATFLMLSDETTVGKHPVEAVTTLDQAIREYTENREKYALFEARAY